MSQQQTAARSGQPRVVGNVVRGCLGNLIEWYDWFVYASFNICRVVLPEGKPDREAALHRNRV